MVAITTNIIMWGAGRDVQSLTAMFHYYYVLTIKVKLTSLTDLTGALVS